MRLSQWEKVIQDCKASLKLNTQNNVKGYYFLSMAQLQIEPRQCKDALSHALQAYELCKSSSVFGCENKANISRCVPA